VPAAICILSAFSSTQQMAPDDAGAKFVRTMGEV
jgi:hypothetical protein